MIRRFLRRWGLVPFGFAQENFHMHHQILRVWGPLRRPRWEVYRWPVGTGSSDKDDLLAALPPGSSECYRRIGFSAERVYSGDDWATARRAFGGKYPDGTTDRTRAPLPGGPS